MNENVKPEFYENTKLFVTPAKAGVQFFDFSGFRPSPE